MLSLNAFKTSLNLPSPLISFSPDWEGAENVSLYVKRDDAIHPIISGNKWRKLSHSLTHPLPKTIISFGGGFSNHLHALGFICFKLGIPFTAIIRGNYSANPSPMIEDLIQWETTIEYVDRKTYQRRNECEYLNELHTKYTDALIIPEGGSQARALAGLQDMMDEIDFEFDVMVAPVASGATLAGIIVALDKLDKHTPRAGQDMLTPVREAIGIGVLKGEGYLEELVEQFLPDSLKCESVGEIETKQNASKTLTQTAQQIWHIDHNYHWGGYAKAPPELVAFCDDFNKTMPFEIEPVYSGKAFWAVKDMLAKGKFKNGSQIVILHTGGLQGAR
ncbi:1-aminocyclopropane-1-carboxylate deaminase/D-cysteine desulfhydrase [Alteromonas sp. KUL150]|uniref:1-aminocyclopropane-1-carboxylate deaminase/D-cysteine desulfhydrase n=1 Tax=unclassified Alteromonas TaxID=2614992 RepID=UPI0013305474|nr:pyridoxal-phosphate dependent enzyme [Alteromonas sp. KUL150]